MLEELLARFRTLEPAGEVAYSPSDIIAGVTSAPVRFAARSIACRTWQARSR